MHKYEVYIMATGSTCADSIKLHKKWIANFNQFYNKFSLSREKRIKNVLEGTK